MSLTLKDVHSIADKLGSAPDLPADKRVLSKKDAVGELRPAIESLRARGYNYEQIADLLTKNGLEISFGSLRQYMADRQGGRKKKTSKTSAASAAPTPVAAQATASAKPTKSTTATSKTKGDSSGSFAVTPDTDDL